MGLQMRRHQDIHRPPEHSSDGIGRRCQLVPNAVEQTDEGARVRVILVVVGRPETSALAGWDKKVIDNIIGSGHDGADANGKRR